MSDNCEQNPITPACEVTSHQQMPLHDEKIKLHKSKHTPTIKVPVVLAERKIQIAVESDITLTPAATEIKRVTKNVFLEQVKLVPVRFKQIDKTDFFEVTRAKLYVSGFIRKNIEYSSSACNGALRDRIADVAFSGFAELTECDFHNLPVIGMSDSSKAQFLNDCNDLVPRLDKYFFQNQVKYNEQPYGELLGANFFELDFSPIMAEPEGSFSTLREKIVLDLYVKVLQVQQFKFPATRIIPKFDEGTLG
ncbi:CsxC family protein [Sporosarcina sp. NPDC096371]|uniref:CsxC family protein n=1 Tax=Sporosarcina sp. NPDC096371 TaxID=3364530 RepID=UPI0037F18FA2